MLIEDPQRYVFLVPTFPSAEAFIIIKVIACNNSTWKQYVASAHSLMLHLTKPASLLSHFESLHDWRRPPSNDATEDLSINPIF